MNATLDQLVYGLAYRNHRFNQNMFSLSFFQREELRDEFYDMYKEQVETEIKKFQFRIKDCMTDG